MVILDIRCSMKINLDNKPKVCIVDSVYSLLIYLLIIEEKDYENTYFFFISPIPKEVCSNFSHSYYFDWPKSIWMGNLLAFYYRITKHLKYPFLKNCEFYGLDNLQLTSALLGNKTMNVIEDGLLNYVTRKRRDNRRIKSLLLGPLRNGDPYGYSDSVSKVFLTGLAPIPSTIYNKVTIIDLKRNWNDKAISYKNTILGLFNLTSVVINDFKSVSSILFTQPLYEDGTLREEEKIEVYRNVIGHKIVAIKPHPKEKTDYQFYFPQAKILKSSVPMELLFLNGIQFSDVYTLFSTVVLTYKETSRIHFLGTRVHPKIFERFGEIVYVDGVVKRLDNK